MAVHRGGFGSETSRISDGSGFILARGPTPVSGNQKIRLLGLHHQLTLTTKANNRKTRASLSHRATPSIYLNVIEKYEVLSIKTANTTPPALPAVWFRHTKVLLIF